MQVFCCEMLIITQKLGSARINPQGRASVKRKKFVNPVQQHKAGCDWDKRTFICVWQGKIWWVPAERTRAATTHSVISRALKLYLVSSLTSLRGGRRAPRFPSPPAPPLVRWFPSGKYHNSGGENVHILKSIHVNAFQIFTSGRYSSVQLVCLIPH